MNKRVLIEGILILVLSIAIVVEGLRLTLVTDPLVVRDVVGPGKYILVLGIFLMITGSIHLLMNYRQKITEKDIESKGMKTRVIAVVITMGVYVSFLLLFGYVVATLVFFTIIFRIAGIKSWKTVAILTLALTAFYYLIFVHYCNIIFPRALIFR